MSGDEIGSLYPEPTPGEIVDELRHNAQQAKLDSERAPQACRSFCADSTKRCIFCRWSYWSHLQQTEKAKMDALVEVKEQKLTDNSIVFDVVNKPTTRREGRVIISAMSETDAQKIADAINECAVSVCGSDT